MEKMTTIQLSENVKKDLDKIKISSNESYNEIIEYLLEDYREINEQTKKDLEEAREDIKKGRLVVQEEVKKRYGLK